MKILIITDAWHPQVNGVVRTYEHLSEELQKLGHIVNVIGPSDFPRRIPTPGYAEIELVFAPYRRLSTMIEAQNPDCIHIATEGPLGWAARRYCLKHNRAFSTAFHTQFPDYIAKRVAKLLPPLFRPAHAIAKAHIRRFHKPSSAMMVATKSLEETLKSWGFKNPMHHVTRGAKLDLFYPAAKTKFKNLKGPIALYVGRIAIEKSIEDFLSMEWSGSKVIVGDGPDREALEAQYPDAVFTGTQTNKDLADHYRSADVFVFPSRTDTFGMVLVEAMACGLPVAAYNVSGPKDIIDQNYLGSLHDTDLAAAARAALKNGDPKKCASHARQHFTWENASRQYEDALLNTVK